MRPSLRSIPVCIDGVIPSCPGVASLRVEGLSIQSGASSTRTWDTANQWLASDIGMTETDRTGAELRMLQVLSYPGVMVLGFSLYAGLRTTGLPLMGCTYLVVAVSAGLITLHEFTLPYRREWRPIRSEVASDAAFMVAVQIMLPYFLSLFVVLTISDATQSRGWTIADIWPHDLPIAIQVGLMLLASDFPRYWIHRAFHGFAPMWRFHAVHHSPQRLYWLNVGRFHPIDKAVQYAVDSLPFILLGVSESVLALYFIFYAINGFFQHSNCAVRLGPLNYLISGPELHRWHHSKLPSQSDTNFGNNLIVWDLLFGTRFLPRDESVGPLGLQNRNYPMGFLSQLASPFVGGLDQG